MRRKAKLGAFWSCYTLVFFIRLPLVLSAGIKAAVQRATIFARTYRKRLDLLNGKLTILFLNGFLPNTVPLLFGELFTAIIYDGIAIDPGSPKMRRSLARHLRLMKPKIAKVVATHAHEEHVGNLNWLSELSGAPLYVSEMTARFLTPFKKLPWVRATIIGQPPNLKQPYHRLAEHAESGEERFTVNGTAQTIPYCGPLVDDFAECRNRATLLRLLGGSHRALVLAIGSRSNSTGPLFATVLA